MTTPSTQGEASGFNSVSAESAASTPTPDRPPTPATVASAIASNAQISSTQADTLAPAVFSSILSSSHPGTGRHDTWEPIYVHTAKCDRCSKHNTSVIQRCGSCNQQLCRPCLDESVPTDQHYGKSTRLNWIIPEHHIKAKKGRAKKPKRAANPLHAVKSARVSNTADPHHTVQGARVSKKESTQPRSHSSMESLKDVVEQVRSCVSMTSSKGKEPARGYGDDFTDDGMSDTPVRRSISPTPMISSKGKEVASASGDHMDKGMCARYDGEQVRRIPSIANQHRPPPMISSQMADRVQGRGSVAQQSAHGVPSQRNEPVLLARLDSVRRVQASPRANSPTEWKDTEEAKDFSRIMAHIGRQKQLKELSDLRMAAWNEHPEIQAMKEQGRVEEARDLVESTIRLLALERGLLAS